MTHTHELLSKKFSTHQTTISKLVNIPGSFIRTRAGRTRTGSDILVSVRTFIYYIITTNFIICWSADEGPCPSVTNMSDSVRVRPALSPQASTERDALDLPSNNLHRPPTSYISPSDVPNSSSGYSWFRTAG